MDIHKNGLETLRVESSRFRGKLYVSARVWVPAKDDADTLVPTPKGLTHARKDRQSAATGHRGALERSPTFTSPYARGIG